MKLRNKKTGEIGNLILNINPNRESYSVLSTENGDTICGNSVIADYDSLAELNEEWEDYEEPKEYWHINIIGAVGLHTRTNGMTDSENSYIEDCQLEIGNYFETKEEAEKAVEKLKAWKRLKDKGFKFKCWEYDDRFATEMPGILIRAKKIRDCEDDLDLLFGGEE